MVLDLRSFIYKHLIGSISSFVENTLVKFLGTKNFNKDKWKKDFKNDFKNNSNKFFFKDLNKRYNYYKKNIWNSILKEERNKIAHQVYHYPHVDYYIFYTIFMAESFLITLDNSVKIL